MNRDTQTVITIEVFVKRKILSLETSAYTHTHIHRVCNVDGKSTVSAVNIILFLDQDRGMNVP